MKEKGSTSLKKKQREQGRLHNNEKGRTRFIFLCVKMRKRVTKKEKKDKEKKEMERAISISDTAKREAKNRNNESGPRNPSPSFLRVTVANSFPIKDKESLRRESTCEPRGRTMILDLTT